MLQLSWLKGYRTLAGALALVGAGVTLVFQGLAADVLDGTKITEGVSSIGMGLAALGIRFK